jgi:hypothetical protein
MDDDQKKFIPQLELIPNIFSPHLPILVRFKTKGAVGTVCALLAQLAIRCRIANFCTRWRRSFKGLSPHGMDDGRIFSKNLRAFLFNDDLSNESNFGRAHLAGQYLSIFTVLTKKISY